MRVIVTRPAAQAADWVAALRERGIDALALPLIDIAAVADGAPLRAAWQTLAGRNLVFFVSPNAVEQFFAHAAPGAGWPAGVLAASPGPGTTRVLARFCVPAGQIVEPAADAPQFDSEALWSRLRERSWQGANVLAVRGDGGRDWLAQALREAGATVDHVTAYHRRAPTLDAPAAALVEQALIRPAEHLWSFSSSEAIDNLAICKAGEAGTASADWGRSLALATHSRIAARARQLGFARVTEARPALEAVVSCIQSMQP